MTNGVFWMHFHEVSMGFFSKVSLDVSLREHLPMFYKARDSKTESESSRQERRSSKREVDEEAL